MKKALTRRISEAAENTAIINAAAITTVTKTETIATAVATVTNSPYVSSLSQLKLNSEKKHMYICKQDLITV